MQEANGPRSASQQTRNQDCELHPSTPIHKSQFYVPSILGAFSNARLSDPHFPAQQVHALMQGAEPFADDSRIAEDDRVVAALRRHDAPFELSTDEHTALQGAIRALTTHIGATDSAVPSSNTGPTCASMRQRMLLGFCLLLYGNDSILSLMHLDFVRNEAFRSTKRMQKQDIDGVAGATSTTQRRSDVQNDVHILQEIMIASLWGCEVAARMLGKENDAARFRTWRAKAQRDTEK